jgi:colicin import membrane protein
MMLIDMPWLPPDNSIGKYTALGLTLLVHVLLAIFLIYGVRWQTQASDVADVVAVELVSAEPAAAVPPAPTFAPPPPKAAEPPPTPKPEVAPPRAPTPPRPPKPDIALKEPAAKTPPKPVEVKPKEPPPTLKDKLKARADSFLDQLKQETERLTQRKQSDAVAADLAKEQAARAAAARDKGMADYLARIRGKIRGNIVLPPDVKGNPEAVFEVTQLPSGEIITARLEQSSGNPALDAAIERAILKSSPLPKPDSSDLFERMLELRYRPREE